MIRMPLPGRSLHARFARAAAGLATGSAMIVTLAAMAVLLGEARVAIDRNMESKSLIVKERIARLGEEVQETADLSRSSLVGTALTDSAGREAYLRPFLEERTKGDKGVYALFDYRGRPIFSTATAGGAERLAAETARSLGDPSRDPAALSVVRDDGRAVLVTGFPVRFSYSQDVVGKLVHVLPIDDLLKAVSEQIGEDVALEVTADGDAIFSEGRPSASGARTFTAAISGGGASVTLDFVIGYKENPFFRQAVSLTLAALAAAAAIMVLALVAARRLAGRLTYRLDRLVAACAAFAEGRKAAFDHDGIQDEIGLLASSIERAFEDRRAAENQLLFIARHDVLTGLPNRAWFEEQVRRAADHAERTDSKLAVLFIDLDRFKPINDNFGHAAGDEVLQRVAERLRERIRRTDLISRRGGDEFMVLLDPVRSARDALAVAEDFARRLREPFMLSTGETVHTGATIGASILPDDARSLDELVRHADAALYTAKAKGRGGALLYSSKAAGASIERYRVERRLREALEKGGLDLRYQPQVRLSDQEVMGWEALLRWNDPELGEVPAATVVSVAEEAGLIHQLGDWVVRRGFIQNRELMAATAAKAPRLAINMSPRQFQNADLAERLIGIAAETGFPIDRLEIEVTETALFQGSDAERRLLEALESHGASVAIDDFGVGYSSLGRLRRLPVDRLKIDSGFVRPMTDDPESREIVRAIIGMGHALGLDVLAEGVESDEQRRLLQDLGCDAAQGFLFSRPLSIDELGVFVLTPPNNRSRALSA
jgi:diguanylate cyclase (GGDEF)-like protein